MKTSKIKRQRISCFKSFDLLGVPISLSFKHEYYFETVTGAIISLINVILIFVYSCLSLNELFKGKSYSIISNEFEDSKSTINMSEISLAFRMIDKDGHSINYDKRYFNYEISVMKRHYIIEESGRPILNSEWYNLKFDFCEKIINTSNFYKILEGRVQPDSMCIIPDQNSYVQGTWGDGMNGFTIVMVNVNRCDNKTMNNQCAPDYEVDRVLDQYIFALSYSGFIINHFADSENVIKRKIYSNSLFITSNQLKKKIIYFKRGIYNLYNNVFINSKKEINFFSYEKETFDIDNEGFIGNNSICSVLITSVNGGIEYTKKILTLWDVLEKIGGMFNIILSISKIINNYISKRILLINMYNYLFQKKNNSKLCQNNSIILNKSKSELKLNSDICRNHNEMIYSEIKKNIKNKNEDKERIAIRNTEFDKSDVNIIQDVKRSQFLSQLLNINLNSYISANNNLMNSKLNGNELIKLTKREKFFLYLFPIKILRKYRDNSNLCKIYAKTFDYFSLEKFNENSIKISMIYEIIKTYQNFIINENKNNSYKKNLFDT